MRCRRRARAVPTRERPRAPPRAHAAARFQVTLRRRYRSIPSPKKYELLHTYHALLRRGDVQPAPLVVRTLTAKGVRSQSGVLVITVRARGGAMGAL